MRLFFRKTLSALLALSLLCTLALPAAASGALGEEVDLKDTQLHEQTQLSTNVFWSTVYSDRRTENLITYTPSGDVTPIVTFGEVLTERNTVSATAKKLEEAGYRVVAGVNGDFYNLSTGLPIGLVVAEGELRSSDGGYHAIGFRADGTAILGKPGVTVSADLGYGVDDGAGNHTQYVRQIGAVNKARTNTGGIHLYTHEFNDRHTTGTTQAGVDVLCTILDGELSIGSSLTARVDSVTEAAEATAIGEGQIVLSVNLQSNSYYVDALRNIPVGTEITLTASAADEAWNDVDYAVGALYSLVENGAVVSGLQADSNPRTAVGQKADGTLVFYTIDGRQPGHSIGATLPQVAQRLIELGCVTALCLDGGGSTTLAVTEPDSTTTEVINTPSDGSGRAVTNQIFLVADSEPSGRLSHFYLEADARYVLAGSKVNLSVSAVDTNYIPMERDYTLSASAGTLEGNELTTPLEGGEITITAEGGGKEGGVTVQAIRTPDSLEVREDGAAVTALTVSPGTQTVLTAYAEYNHLPLKADPEALIWAFEGDCGVIDAAGTFTAYAPGSGTLTLTAGEVSVSVPVTVTTMSLKTVEDFEGQTSIFDGVYGENAAFSRVSEQVRLGDMAGKLEYTLTEEQDYTAVWHNFIGTSLQRVYGDLNLWVYGDGTGNILELVYDSDAEQGLLLEIARLDFTGWKQITIPTGGGHIEIQGLRVRPGVVTYVDDGLGGVTVVYPEESLAGTVYLDQIVSSFGGIVDNEVPAVTLTVSETDPALLTGTVTDAVDGILPQSAISVTWDGEETEFAYNAQTGAFSTSAISDGAPHRVTVTARDASGNIGRASYDIPVGAEWVPLFSDTQGYWAANFVDYLYNAGITTGYEDGTFRPNQNISRAQFAVMLYRHLGLGESQYAGVELPFADVAQIGEYAIPAIKALYTEGVINGTVGADGQLYFNPNHPLTRAQAATMIGRTQEKGYAMAELTFTDAASIPAYAVYYIQTMAAQGIINGYEDGTFKPHSNITRGQMAKILYNLM